MDLFFCLFLLILFICAGLDFLVYHIPNELIIAIFVLFFINLLMMQGLSLSVIKDPLMVFGIVLPISFFLYLLNIFGAGDAKLISVVSLWMASSNVILFLMIMAIAGGLIGFIYMLIHTKIESIRYRILAQLSRSVYLSKYLRDKYTKKPLYIYEKNKEKKYVKEVVRVPYAVAVLIGVVITLKIV